MSSARGSRFAQGREPSRDAAGHSLPSNRSMHYVELQLVCKHHPEGERPILGAWWIASHFDDFDPAQVNERANVAVELQPIPEPDGTTRLRFKMTCPKCGQQPVYRHDLIDAALASLYVQGAASKIVPYAI